MKALVLIGVVWLCSSCCTVPAWEREVLADRRLQVALRPSRSAAQRHYLIPREGTRPPESIGGGGCGCD